jgi:hypothetical protein
MLITVAVFGVMFLIFFAFLHYLSNDRSTEDGSPAQSWSVQPGYDEPGTAAHSWAADWALSRRT